MLGNASRDKTSNLESFAHWPTQRFETIAQAGPAVTVAERCLFPRILASVSGGTPTFSWKPAFSGSGRRRPVSRALQKGAEGAFVRGGRGLGSCSAADEFRGASPNVQWSRCRTPKASLR